MRIADGPVLPALLVAVALGAAMVPGSTPERLGRSGDLQVAHLDVLGDVRVGSDVGGWTVRALRIDQGERAHVELTRGEVSLVVMLAARGSEPFHAPVSTRTRDLFYQDAPDGPRVPPAERDEVLRAIAERVRAHEHAE